MKTEKYVNQLLEEIEELKKTVPPCRSRGTLFIEDEDFEEQMMEMEEHVLNERGAELVKLSGISEKHLPDPGLLSEAQVEKLAESLQDLLEHYQFFPDFPEKFPARLQYELLRKNWNKFKVPLLDFQLHYEFCEYDEENCPFPGYCTLCDEYKSDAGARDNTGGHKAIIKISTELDAEEFGDVIQQFNPLYEGKFIRGIFNYCDRRCERCDFSSRCSAFAIGKRHGDVPDEEVLSESWKNELEGIYEKLIGSVLEEKQRLDIDAADLAKDDGFNIPMKKELIYKPEALQMLTIAEYYTKSLHEWLAETGIERFREQIGNASVFKTILWLQMPIATKMFRSFMGEEEAEEDPVQNDSNGSAKMAIMHIKESLAAWCWILFKRAPLKNVAMKYAILLNDLLNEMENSFPRAEEFIRPGFDQEEKDWEIV